MLYRCSAIQIKSEQSQKVGPLWWTDCFLFFSFASWQRLDTGRRLKKTLQKRACFDIYCKFFFWRKNIFCFPHKSKLFRGWRLWLDKQKIFWFFLQKKTCNKYQKYAKNLEPVTILKIGEKRGKREAAFLYLKCPHTKHTQINSCPPIAMLRSVPSIRTQIPIGSGS